MLKATKSLRECALSCIAEMQEMGLTEMAMKEPKGLLVSMTIESIKSKGYLPLEKIEVKGKYFYICQKF